MVLSNDEAFLRQARHLRQYDEEPTLPPGATNWKLSDLHAAVGLAQLSQFDRFLTRRRAIADRYRQAWRTLPCEMPPVPAGRTHSYFRFVVRLTATGSTADPVEAFVTKAATRGLHCRRPVFRPLHRYSGMDGFPRSEEAARTALSIPLYPSLTDEEVQRVIQIVDEVCHEVA